MQLLIDRRGQVRCLYAETIDLAALGSLSISRVSQVEPDDCGRWQADLSLVGGPVLGPFEFRSQALRAEQRWLEENWLVDGNCPKALGPGEAASISSLAGSVQ